MHVQDVLNKTLGLNSCPKLCDCCRHLLASSITELTTYTDLVDYSSQHSQHLLLLQPNSDSEGNQLPPAYFLFHRLSLQLFCYNYMSFRVCCALISHPEKATPTCRCHDSQCPPSLSSTPLFQEPSSSANVVCGEG